MKRKRILFITVLLIFINEIQAQTFRQYFDVYENSLSANNGQGASFQSNAVNILNNNEYSYLESYINMFRATKDKRYLDRFIIHVKRIQERRDDNITQI